METELPVWVAIFENSKMKKKGLRYRKAEPFIPFLLSPVALVLDMCLLTPLLTFLC